MASIRNFVSHVPEELLTIFLAEHSIAIESAEGKAGHIANSIEIALVHRGPGARGRLLHEIETVCRMAGESGQVALGDVTLAHELKHLKSAHARALWLFLNDRSRFRQAEDILYADERRYGRQWNAFVGPKHTELLLKPETQEAFKQALRLAFDTPNVHIEIFQRSRPDAFDLPADDDEAAAGPTQITIYREDRPNSERAFDEDGVLVVQTRSPVIEAAVMYDPGSGTIECVSGHRQTREDVVRSFGTTLLGCEGEFELQPAPLYTLAALKERYEFPFEPIDGIEEVKVALFRLYPVDTNAERITLEALDRDGRDIWKLAEQHLGEGALKENFRIGQAKLVVHYVSNESRRTRKLPITITPPHRSNIKEQSEIERIIANKYLPRWGLVTVQ